RAGASNRTMVAALGVNIRLLYTVVFGFGAALAGLAGLMAGPIYAVQPGMGEQILIQVFVVIVIGGIGSIRGALVGAILVGMVDTLGRAFLRPLLSTMVSPNAADAAGPALASILIYVLMAAVLFFRPQGLFPALVIGAISIRTSGVSFIMITLAFAQMLYYLGISLETYGGDNGMPLRTRSQFAGLIDLRNPYAFYYLVLALLVLFLVLGHRLVN